MRWPSFSIAAVISGSQAPRDIAALASALLEKLTRPISRTIVDDDDLLIDRHRVNAVDQLNDRLALVEARNDDRSSEGDGPEGIQGQCWGVAHWVPGRKIR